MVVLYDIDGALIYIFHLTWEEFFNSREFISHLIFNEEINKLLFMLCYLGGHTN